MVERPQRVVAPPPGAAQLKLDTLASRVRDAIPDAQISTITLNRPVGDGDDRARRAAKHFS